MKLLAILVIFLFCIGCSNETKEEADASMSDAIEVIDAGEPELSVDAEILEADQEVSSDLPLVEDDAELPESDT